jgi:hypothetical protein
MFEEEKEPNNDSIEANPRADGFFWVFFYLRLALFAVVSPVLVKVLFELANALLHGESALTILTEGVLGGLVIVIAIVFGLQFASAFVADSFLEYFTIIPMLILEYCVLPVIGFALDLICDTPQLFVARFIESVARGKSRPSDVGHPFWHILVLVALSLVFLASNSFFIPFYEELKRMSPS